MARCSSPNKAKGSSSEDEEEDYDVSYDSATDEDDEEELQFYSDGIREMTRKEMGQYLRAFYKTGGFDMPSFPGTYACGRIEIITGHRLYTEREIPKCARAAIDHYNNENGTNWEYVKIVSANNQAAEGLLYYLTFEVKEKGTPLNSATTTFQARVLAGFSEDDIHVELCRPKPAAT